MREGRSYNNFILTYASFFQKKRNEITTVALTFVIYSINNLYSVPYEHIVIFRFDNHFWNFLAFFEITTVALTFVIYSINNLYSVPYEHIVTFRFENHFWNFLAFLK